MTSFPASLKSVFGGRAAAEVSGPPHFPRPWSLFNLVPLPRVERAPAGVAKMVECEIIPRLVMAHRMAPAAEPATTTAPESNWAAPPLGIETTGAFVRMLLSRGSDSLTAFVETLSRGNVSEAAIYADLLAPTAALLGDMWDDDRLSYTEVTIGLGRLQQLIRDLGWRTPYDGEGDALSPSALFAPRPGEQQTFGFYLIEELFRWSGWRTWVETSSTDQQMIANVRCQAFDMACLSVARHGGLADLASTIEAIRNASRNRDLFVLVTGSPFLERQDLVSQVGADGAAANGGEALRMASLAVRRPPTGS